MSVTHLPPLPRHQALYRLTSLARPVDTRYPSNRIVLALMAVGFVGVAMMTWLVYEEPLVDLALIGLSAAVAVFITWALARELHVDHAWSAHLSAAATPFLLWEWPDVGIFAAFAVLFLVRMVARTVSPAARPFDAAIVLVLTLAATYSTDIVFLWLAGTLAFILDALLAGGKRWHWLFALACTLGGLYFVGENAPMLRELGFLTLPPWTLILAGMAVLLAIGSALEPAPESCDDASHQPLMRSRLRAARAVAIFAGLVAWFGGFYGMRVLGLVWLVIAVTSLAVWVEHVRRRIGKKA